LLGFQNHLSRAETKNASEAQINPVVLGEKHRDKRLIAPSLAKVYHQCREVPKGH